MSFDSHPVVSHVVVTAILSSGKELFVLVYRVAVNPLVDIVGPGLSPSLEIHDLRLGKTS